jgi:hypothetical protein
MTHKVNFGNSKDDLPVTEEKMYCYVWWEKDKPDEAKFGERWVKVGQIPSVEVKKRIKDSVGVRKDLFNDGTIQIQAVWDMSELAKTLCPERFKQHGRVDDFIRPHIGHRKGKTGEVHELPADEVEIRVNRFIKSVGQPMPVLGITQNQHDAAVDFLNQINNSKRTLLGEFCPRFGKTTWSGVMIRETERPLAIIASYVLTSFASFEKDLGRFEQFRNFELIDSADEGWEDQVLHAIAAGLQAVVFLSMCNGSKRQDKIDFLFNLKHKRIMLIDEADYGVHQIKQSQPLVDARDPDDIVIPMSGTNGDKAMGAWKIDYHSSVMYPELIIEKRLAATEAISKLKYFEIDPSRHQLYVGVEFYQMGVKSAVDHARKVNPDCFVQDGIFLPSWSKFAANPVKAKGFFTYMLQAIFEGKGGDDSLNIDYQTGRKASDGIKVAMMFLPGSTTNANLQEIKPIAEQALRGFKIILVSGGEDMTNATAEREVKEAIEVATKMNQHVLILSAGMAQRSFSIPELSEVYLAYDSGDSAATTQKMSRAFTPNQNGKVGIVVSLSFDPNRDDKYDAWVIPTARNLMRTKGITDLKVAVEMVLRTVDIFNCQPDGRLKIEIDDYLETALTRNSINRIIGNDAEVEKLEPEVIQALITGNIDLYRAAMQAVADKGKTRLGNKTKGRIKAIDMSDEKTLILAREMIATISQHSDIIRYYGGNTFDEAFALMDADGEEIQNEVTEQFGIDYELIKELILTKFINRDLLDLKYAK